MLQLHSPNLLKQSVANKLLIIEADSTVRDVVKLIDQAKELEVVHSGVEVESFKSCVSCVLVVAKSQLVGIMTQSDLIRLMAKDSDINQIKVSAVMTQPVKSLGLKDFQDTETPLNLFDQYHFSHLPLVDEHNYPVGLVTMRSLLTLDSKVRSHQQSQTHQIEHESLLTAIANRVNASLDLQVILDTTVAEIRQFLNTDRVIAYKFEPDWSGVVVAESVTQSCNSLLGRVLIDPYFGKAMVEPYKNGRIQVTDNIYLGLTECHTNFLEDIQVKALIVVPILQEGQLWGLLAAQECLRSRFWDRSSVTLLQQLATHVGIAIRQAHTTAQMRQLNQELENKILERTKALITSETRLNLIVSNVSDGILIVDQDGKIVFANPSAAKIFDLSIAEIIGQSIGIPNSLSRQFEINHLKKDGKIGASVLQFVLIEWNNHPAYLISLHDITERQEAEAKLSESNQQLEISNQELARATRLKDEFLANMSHELRTPLNAILGMTEGLQEGVFGAVNEKQIKALQTVERSGSHLLSLINDILDVAKIESGQIELDYALTDVAALCQSSLAFIKQQSVKKRIQLEIKLPQQLSELLIDERRMRQVLINLLNNAVKFTLEEGRITVEVTQLPTDIEHLDFPTPQFIRIAVIDTGIGIAPENIHKLFQPFIQIDSALNRQYAGTGLGLSLVKRIVELHGGKVSLTSELGVGSCFAIDLPCNSSSPIPLSLPDINTSDLEDLVSTTTRKKSHLILLAEDNEANISTFSEYLEAKGYRTLLASNGKEAIALAKDHHPDLILMDIQMPVMDGLEAIQHIRLDPNLVDIPIIALTALAMTGDRERCMAAGASDYLAKPIKLKTLADTIWSILGNRK